LSLLIALGGQALVQTWQLRKKSSVPISTALFSMSGKAEPKLEKASKPIFDDQLKM